MQTNDDNKLNSTSHNDEIDEVTEIKYFGGHEYDGIKELDNPMPPWLKYLFYITVILSAGYLVLVFVFEDDDYIQKKEYRKEIQASMKKAEVDTLAEKIEVKPATQEEILAAGETVYKNLCLVCHGKYGEGLVGPNFTDDYWIHGGSADDLKKVIVEGVIEKGMISYKSQLNEKQISNVTAYILSLHGTNPPNQKAAQGEKYIR